MPPTLHTNFEAVKVHTAKCDTCDKHNTLIIYRCADCGTQCCTPCWQERGGDDNHVLNGGDRGWIGETKTKTPKQKQTTTPRAELRPISYKKITRNSTRGIAQKRKVKNKRVLEDDGDETEEAESYDAKSTTLKRENIQSAEKYPLRLTAQDSKAKELGIRTKEVHSPFRKNHTHRS